MIDRAKIRITLDGYTAQGTTGLRQDSDAEDEPLLFARGVDYDSVRNADSVVAAGASQTALEAGTDGNVVALVASWDDDVLLRVGSDSAPQFKARKLVLIGSAAAPVGTVAVPKPVYVQGNGADTATGRITVLYKTPGV